MKGSRVLLINPPTSASVQGELHGAVNHRENRLPPLGLLYLAASLEQNNDCDVVVLDLADRRNTLRLEDVVVEFRPNLVGLTVFTPNLLDVLSCIETIKEIDRSILICIGGPHVSAFPHESAGLPGVDIAIEGEGEKALSDLVSAINGTGLRSNVAKMRKSSRRLPGRLVRGSISADLDKLPFPQRNILSPSTYRSILSGSTNLATMAASRGCPFHCTFCSTPRGSFRHRSAASVFAEMREASSSGFDEIHFIDDTFNFDRNFVIELCAKLIASGDVAPWSARGRVDRVDRLLIEKLRSANCRRIHYGVETASDYGLKLLGKQVDLDTIKRAFDLTRKSGIATVAYLMIGCPGDKDVADIERTIDFAISLDPDFAIFNILIPYPGSALYRTAIERGLIAADHWPKFARSPYPEFRPSPWTEFLDQATLQSLQRLAHRRFYFRPRYLLRSLYRTRNPQILRSKITSTINLLLDR